MLNRYLLKPLQRLRASIKEADATAGAWAFAALYASLPTALFRIYSRRRIETTENRALLHSALLKRFPDARRLADDDPLKGRLDALAQRASMPPVDLMVSGARSLDVFAWPGAIFVTQGLIDLLPPRELDGVLVHELSHIHRCDPARRVLMDKGASFFRSKRLIKNLNSAIKHRTERAADDLAAKLGLAKPLARALHRITCAKVLLKQRERDAELARALDRLHRAAATRGELTGKATSLIGIEQLTTLLRSALDHPTEHAAVDLAAKLGLAESLGREVFKSRRAEMTEDRNHALSTPAATHPSDRFRIYRCMQRHSASLENS